MRHARPVRSRFLLATLVLTAAALAAGGCYSPDLTGPGRFLCASPAQQCPAGFTCQSGVCAKPGQPPADGGADRRGWDGLPPAISCRLAGTPVTIETALVGDGFDFERGDNGLLVVSYTAVTTAPVRQLRLATRANSGVSWTTKPLAPEVADVTALGLDNGCVGAVVAYRTATGSLSFLCDGCSSGPPGGDQVGAAAIDLVPHSPGLCIFWVVYQTTGDTTYMRRARLELNPPKLGFIEDVPVTVKSPVTHIAQDWDSSSTTHTITYVAGQKVQQTSTQGTQWIPLPIDDTALHPEDRGVAQAGSSVVYATGGIGKSLVRHYGSGLHQDIAEGSRPALAQNGTVEAVAFIQGSAGIVSARTGAGPWSKVVATVPGATRILIREGDPPDGWEVVFSTKTSLQHATVRCN